MVSNLVIPQSRFLVIFSLTGSEDWSLMVKGYTQQSHGLTILCSCRCEVSLFIGLVATWVGPQSQPGGRGSQNLRNQMWTKTNQSCNHTFIRIITKNPTPTSIVVKLLNIKDKYKYKNLKNPKNNSCITYRWNMIGLKADFS